MIELEPIGTVESPLSPTSPPRPSRATRARPRRVAVDEPFAEALDGVAAGDELIVITWLERADRTVLRVHPRDDPARPLTGIFATRSPDRPNPIGLHRVEVAEIDGPRLHVRNLEALDGTPVLDLKPVLSRDVGER